MRFSSRAGDRTSGSRRIHHHSDRQLDGRETRPLHPLLRLQQSIGNRALTSLLQIPQNNVIRRQPTSEGPSLRDVPILLEKLQLDVGQNLLDYGHHLYQAATLYPNDPDALKTALGRYALGANVLKDTYRFFGVSPDTAGKLALGTGILFKGLTLVKEGELTLDFQFDIGRGVKFETNVKLGVDPKNLTDLRKADVNFGFVRRF